MSIESAMECGVNFVKQYYNAVAKDATQLASMYVGGSQLVTETGSIKTGDSIAAYLEQKAAEPSKKFTIEAIGAYPGVSESVLVMVRGAILTVDTTRKFNQVFSLAKRDASKYYIQNDVLEIVDSATQETQAEVEEPAAPVAAVEETPAATYEPTPEEEDDVDQQQADDEDIVNELADAEPAATTEPEEAAQVVEQQPRTPTPEPEEKEEEPVSTGWAAIARKPKGKTAVTTQRAVQRVAGGTIPGVVAAKSKEEKEESKRGVSPNRARKGPAPPQKPTFSVFVSGLPAETTEDDISKAFGKYGTLAGKRLFPEKSYCFVDFAEKADMQKVLEPETVQVKGSAVKVTEKQQRGANPPSGANKSARPARPTTGARK
eukprot:TRINITY_DN1816_c0_g1_i1.p1 TRINITY_DN1816_c0_g1~~TRINITY_DN1816_c0_g1_i1.p1  ORF type:complete len:375 (+),score=121.34 TRINITY_DN1816_c0_g1_i1:87-1211(+)